MIVLVPALHVSTEEARKVLPKEIPHKDAGVYSASRAAMLVGSLITGHFENLPEALEDKLHTPYRLPPDPGGVRGPQRGSRCRAYNAVISGSGSTLMAYVPEEKGSLPHCREALAAPFRKLALRAPSSGQHRHGRSRCFSSRRSGKILMKPPLFS